MYVRARVRLKIENNELHPEQIPLECQFFILIFTLHFLVES